MLGKGATDGDGFSKESRVDGVERRRLNKADTRIDWSGEVALLTADFPGYVSRFRSYSVTVQAHARLFWRIPCRLNHFKTSTQCRFSTLLARATIVLIESESLIWSFVIISYSESPQSHLFHKQQIPSCHLSSADPRQWPLTLSFRIQIVAHASKERVLLQQWWQVRTSGWR